MTNESLIPISYDNPERPTVSGRELHELLGINTPYTQWFDRMTEYGGFAENVDYVLVSQICATKNPKNPFAERTDHQLTIPMAKELCMIQRNERGKQARQYFIKVEQQWNSPTAIMRRAVLIANEQNEQLKATNKALLAENNSLKTAAEFAKDVCIGENCRTVGSIAKDYGISAEKLNSILHGLKIQYKNSDKQWVLYHQYQGKGYTRNRKGKPFQHNNGTWTTPNTTVWTVEGEKFIHAQLKKLGMTPRIDPASRTVTAGKLVEVNDG